MLGLKAVRMIAATMALAATAACGGNYVPTAPGIPDGVGLVQPPSDPAQPPESCARTASANFAGLPAACDTMPVKPPTTKHYDQ
jgi:hypothetical protein